MCINFFVPYKSLSSSCMMAKPYSFIEIPKLMYKHRIGRHKDFNKVIYYVGMQSVIIIEGHDKFDGV